MPNQDKYDIRQAVKEDLLDVTYMVKRFVKESQNTHLGWNQDKVYSSLCEMVGRDDFLILLLEHEDDIVGMFIAFAVPCMFSDKLQAVELAWYVLPDHRASRKSLKMIDMYEDWAKERNVALLNMINLDVINPEKAARFYERKGYKLAENTFTKELN